GQSYPEMEKILQLCEMFCCNLDTLIKGNVTREEKEDLYGYDQQMNRFSLLTASSVAMIIASVGLMVILEVLLQGIVHEDVMAIGMFAMVGIAVSILIVSGINHKYFKKRYSTVQDFYTEEERYRFNRKFAVAIAAGVCLILFGLCLNMGLELLEDPVLEEAGGGIQLFFVAAAVWIFIYFGVQRAKYEVGEYNKKNRGEQDSGAKLTGKISGVIMLLATAIFFYFGLVLDMFRIAWVVFPIGGLLCAAANVIWGDKK
ncbi:XRE family transcriptional regulator, partial [Enterocloster citroniae]